MRDRKLTRKQQLARDERRVFRHPVVARKTVCGITVGFIVGWKYNWSNRVRNIRHNQIFPDAESAIAFRDAMEKRRELPTYPEFEILE